MSFPLHLGLLLLLLLALCAPVGPTQAQQYLGEGASGHQQPPGRGATRQLTPPTHRTPVQRPLLLARIDRGFRDYMDRYTRGSVEQLSRACARSRFLPDGTLRIRFADFTVSVSMPGGQGLLIGRELAHPEVMYFFLYDGTTSCRVYSRATGPLGG